MHASMLAIDGRVTSVWDMIRSAGRLWVDLGGSLLRKGIFLARRARSYSELVKRLPTTRAAKMPKVIGRKMLIELVVSSIITSSEKVRRVYAESIALAPVSTKVTAVIFGTQPSHGRV